MKHLTHLIKALLLRRPQKKTLKNKPIFRPGKLILDSTDRLKNIEIF